MNHFNSGHHLHSSLVGRRTGEPAHVFFSADNLQKRIVNTNWLTCPSLHDSDFATLLGNLRCVTCVGVSSAWRPSREFEPHFSKIGSCLDKRQSYYILHTGISSQISTKLRDLAFWQARAGCYSQAAFSSYDSKTLYDPYNKLTTPQLVAF